MEWNKLPESNDIIKILQEQGQSNFNPLELRNQIIIAPNKKIGQKAKKIIEENKLKLEKEVILHEELIFKDILSSQTSALKWNIKYLKEKLIGFKTEEYKIKFLIYLLSHLNKTKKVSDKMYHIYYTLKTKTIPLTQQKYYEDNISVTEKLMEDLNIIKLQMTKLSSFLYPLDYFNTDKQKLDDWQKDVLDKIDQKKNILIVARTSSGKTVCSTYASLVNSKVLFVVPSDELARQVAGILRNLLKGSVALITNKDFFIENDSYKVLVGTPLKIEEYLIENGHIKFQYAVFDEVHQIRDINHEGDAFEKIIMLVKCKVLMMSATLANHEDLISWFERIKGESIDLVEYKKRFINQQRYIWLNNELTKLHPLSSVSVDDIKNDNIGSNFTFTAQDLYDFYQNCMLINPEYAKKFNPNDFFNKRIIHHNDISQYENYVKSILKLSSDEELKLILDSYKFQYLPTDYNLLSIINVIKEKKMYPAIFFKKDSKKCIEEFKMILDVLEKTEMEQYPYYKENLLIIQSFVERQSDEIKKLEEISTLPGNYTSFSQFRYDKENQIKSDCLYEMKEKFKLLYKARDKKGNRSFDKELDDLLSIEELASVDIYRPHPDFTFTNTITSDKMRKIKNRLLKTLDQKIGYDNIFLKGIERGIILYHSHLQPSFQREIQSLINQKEINFVIADDSLAYGVNMPIKTVVLLGERIVIENWDVIKAVQMNGRSGRRGIDREGNIIFCNVNWKDILRASDMNISGIYKPSVVESLPLQFESKFTEIDLLNLCKSTITEHIDQDLIDENQRKLEFQLIGNTINNSKLIWLSRTLGEKSFEINNFIEKIQGSASKDELLLHCLVFIFNCENDSLSQSIIHNKLINFTDDSVIQLKKVGNLILNIYNNTTKYVLKNKIKDLFLSIKILINKYQLQ